ncbi:MAG TPA: homoserine dehydrogenase [Polyangiaceae bacterium]|jgi:homoserine dehydrogenase
MKPVRLGLLGCGTVGGGVVKLLGASHDAFSSRVGAKVEIARVLVRDPEKERVPELDRAIVTTDPEVILGDSSIDVFVEVMGGVDPARGYVTRALESGRAVVTANKMLLALHGPELVDLAIARGVDLAFEGSVGGGIPVVRVLREALASDWVTSLVGIVNGTCNFVLTRMRENGLSFDAAVKEAQAKGYAEAEPSLDVDGHDAAHKLVVLAMLSFGARIDSATVPTEGIRAIEAIDHDFADRFGYAVKHLAIGRDRGASVELRVHPALVKKTSTIANVGGVLNAISLEGHALGPCLLSGRGAGDLPTAVSVVADVIDVARAIRSGVPGLATRALQLKAKPLAPLGEIESRYYLRFQVFDRPGVLARITGALGEARVSIEQMVQQGGGDSSGATVQVVLLTHVAEEKALQQALRTIAAHDYVAAPTQMLRVHE